jgi:uncharacterized protein (TIGR02996 family)
MTDGGALLAAVLEHPGDDTPRLVYADWLDDHGRERRAAFVRREVARRVPPDAPGGRFPQAIPWTKRDCLTQYWGADGNTRLWRAGEIREACEALPVGDTMPHRVVFRRGFAARLSIDLADWQTHAPALLDAHPLERVEVADVPGLTFEVRRDAPGWVLAGRVVVPGAEWRRENGNADRVWLVRAAPAFVRDIVDSLRAQAGDRWPGAVETIPPGAVLRTRQGAL